MLPAVDRHLPGFDENADGLVGERLGRPDQCLVLRAVDVEFYEVRQPKMRCAKRLVDGGRGHLDAFIDVPPRRSEDIDEARQERGVGGVNR